ncbi:MAG: MBL fold metallo-hydrolase [Candidatus Verstraetearchaeota archaeon]|nr:MBL fold metallo-hydrolase [Candidatus Verstraetearchaeota archaeon]
MHDESFIGAGLSSNVYLLNHDSTYYLFDASGDPGLLRYLASAGIHGSMVGGVFLTHGHFDHVAGLESLREFETPVFINEKDRTLMEETTGEYPSFMDISEANEILSMLGLVILETPGHTPGSACFYSPSESLLISGDTVFPDGYFGRTDLPGGSDSDMLESLTKLSGLRVEALLAGHGHYVESDGSRCISEALACAKSMLGH